MQKLIEAPTNSQDNCIINTVNSQYIKSKQHFFHNSQAKQLPQPIWTNSTP